jgi:hypothetical protein
MSFGLRVSHRTVDTVYRYDTRVMPSRDITSEHGDVYLHHELRLDY